MRGFIFARSCIELPRIIDNHRQARHLLIGFLFASICVSLNAQDVTGTWSGTISRDEKWEGSTGSSVKHIQLTVVNNVVTGTVKGWEKSSLPGGGTCNIDDQGQGELWRVSLNMDGTYDLEATTPKYSCRPDGRKDEEYTITIGSQKIIDRNFLNGKLTNTVTSPVAGTGTYTVTWSLHQGPLDLVFIIKPEPYDTWLPEPSKFDDRPGTSIKINMEVRNLHGGAVPLKVGSFEIRLNNTSKEPGICINAPVNPGDPKPDLQFIPEGGGEISEEGQFVFVSSPDGNTGSVTVGAFDGGGWSMLTAEAVMEDGMRLKGKLMTPTGTTEILLPKRQPGSHIGDSWLKLYGNPGEMDDKEKSMNNTNPGDGLTAYEEYRGVMSMAEFHRLKPTVKELGLQGKKGEEGLFSMGVGWFEAATGLKVVKFSETEIGSDRRLNKNSQTSHDYDQYVLKIENGPTSKMAAGENRPTALDHMVPMQSELIVINVAYIDQVHQLQDSTARAEHMIVPYTRDEMLASTVAHEIAHGVDVNHHGVHSNAVQGRMFYEGGNLSVHIFDEHQKEIPLAKWPVEAGTNRHYYEIFGNVGDQGCEESGDLACFMAYTSMYNWSFKTGSDGSLNYYMVPLLPIGRKLCTRSTGTGINAMPNYFGKAGNGNCAGQVKLK
jgi:hypothetical protein